MQFGLTSLTIVVFPLWVFVPLPKGGVLYVDLRRFAQVCLTRFSIDLIHYCTVQYHEQENHFIEVLPSSWWSAGDWIALNLVSCYMTASRWRIKNSMQLLFVFYYVSLDVFVSGVWATSAGLRDPSLRELASKLESTVIASRATGTTDAYRMAFLRWRGFTASSDEIQAFPAKLEHVALYLQHVLDTTKSHSSVDSSIYGIQWAHNLADLPSPAKSPIVHAISRASKRIMGTRVTNK